MTKGHVQRYPEFNYSLKLPASWASSPGSGWNYMGMRKDSSAAVFCTAMTNNEPVIGSRPRFKEIVTLAKRAPVMGKNLKEDGQPVLAKVGARGYPARVGHATGKLFGEDDGDVYWIDIRHKQPEGPWHVYCVGAAKKSASAEVKTELKAVMRSIEGPGGKKVLEPGQLAHSER